MKLPALLVNCDTRPGASDASLSRVEQQLGCPLPPDYRLLLRESDGLEGFIGRDNYIILWSSSDLLALNGAYRVADFVPGLTLFGTDGGDAGYGFRLADAAFDYVSVPLVGMGPTVVSTLGRSLNELLQVLSQQH